MRFTLLLSMLVMIVFVAACGKKAVRQEVSEADQPALIMEAADQYFANGDFENAFRAYGVVYYNYPTSREYIDGAIGLAKCYNELDNYEKGFDVLFGLLRENLIPSKVPEIYNVIAEFYVRSAGISEQLTGEGSSDYQTAVTFYGKSISYPNSSDSLAKGYAQYQIGVLQEQMDDIDQAALAFKETIKSYPGTEWALRAEQSMTELEQRAARRSEYERDGLLPETPVETEESDQLYQLPQRMPETIDRPAGGTMEDSTLTPVIENQDTSAAVPDTASGGN